MMPYTAFNSLLYKWKTDKSPRAHSYEPFYLDEWLNKLRFSKDNLYQEIRNNLFGLDEKGKLEYLEEMRARLDAVVDIVANLPTVKPTHLLQAIKRGKKFSLSDAYEQAVTSLSSQKEDNSSPQRDEVAASPFQNEAIQADFVEVYQFITKRLAAAKQEPAINIPADKQRRKRKVQPALTWNLGPKDLADLVFTLMEKKHLTINETSKNALSRAITSLFELLHAAPVASEDWQILASYLGTEIVGNPRAKTITETPRKRAKNSLYEGIKGIEDE